MMNNLSQILPNIFLMKNQFGVQLGLFTNTNLMHHFQNISLSQNSVQIQNYFVTGVMRN